MLNFFRSSSPKKQPVKPAPEPEPEQPPAKAPERRLTDNFARFLKHDGMFARAFISFRDVAAHCDTQTFECSYPLIGQRIESRTLTRTMTVGEITLQIFRLPPLPGIPPDRLPQSLEECNKGLRHVKWHKTTYYEGTLTQYGGDCSVST